MKSRTRARCAALQALYEIDIAEHIPEIVIHERIVAQSLDTKMADFTKQIVLGVWPLKEDLDQFISEQAPEWPLDQVAVIDRNILRIALWEFALSGITPMKVAINEAVELAKMYGSDSAPRFVNGVLGSLAIRQNEIQRALRHLNSE